MAPVPVRRRMGRVPRGLRSPPRDGAAWLASLGRFSVGRLPSAQRLSLVWDGALLVSSNPRDTCRARHGYLRRGTTRSMDRGTRAALNGPDAERAETIPSVRLAASVNPPAGRMLHAPRPSRASNGVRLGSRFPVAAPRACAERFTACTALRQRAPLIATPAWRQMGQQPSAIWPSPRCRCQARRSRSRLGSVRVVARCTVAAHLSRGPGTECDSAGHFVGRRVAWLASHG